MMASERSKELAAKQRAERKALRAKKRNSDNPRDWGTIRQLREAWKATYEFDKKLPLFVFGAWALTAVVGLVIGLIISTATGSSFSWLWFLIFGVLFGMTVAMLVFTNRLKKATYTRYEGQAGSGEVALSMLNKKKYQYTPAIAFNRNKDVVHRVVGPCGLVLVGDGQTGAIRKLLKTEANRHSAIAYNVDVETIVIGDGEGQVPLNELAKHIQRMPKKLDKTQVIDLSSRLKALDASKPRMPIPKGPMPNMKGAHRAMRGR
ncbi:DUF4191 domain-containing protein [Propionimicrobium sp. BV2F7]|uniref:DUF4191 domain-containing protein n=1 Tax=Propionimicrobium sp. BV2F7 TaxID=1111131 RepID=UPI0018CBFCF9|nr:DUF4191 domain-containing protein [Propionimicrobium sp. BV2F7]